MQKEKVLFTDQSKTASVFVFRTLVEFMEKKGIDTDEACIKANITKDQINCVDLRLPVSSYYQLLVYALSKTKDKDFGYNLGCDFDTYYGRELLNYNLINCNTVENALDAINHYITLMVNDIWFEKAVHQSFLFIKMNTTCPNKILIRHMSEAYIGDMIRTINNIADEYTRPVKIFFKFDKPSYQTKFEEVLKVPVLYGQKDNVIVFKQTVDRVPVSLKDKKVIDVFRKNIDECVKAKFDPKGLTIRVVEMMANSIHGRKEPTLSDIAKKLSMSVKVLQAGLKIEGEPFHKIINNVKKDLALSYVRNRNIPVHDIAMMLGFEDMTVFKYKFKHWTGQDIDSFRQLH